MFAYPSVRQLVETTRPLVVVEREKVLGSFITLEAAQAFIARQGSETALILRHNGQKWVKAVSHLENAPRVSGTDWSGDAPIPSPGAMIVSRIQEMLEKHPHVTYTASARHVEIPAQTRNGFKVRIQRQPGHYTVAFEGWHAEFTDAESALDCFVFGLSTACRLRVLICGGIDYRWQVQRQLGGRWATDSEAGTSLYRFWCKRGVRFLQNDIVSRQTSRVRRCLKDSPVADRTNARVADLPPVQFVIEFPKAMTLTGLTSN